MQDGSLVATSGSTVPGPKLPANLTEQTVLSVHHWTERLFSLTLTRDPAFVSRTASSP